MRTLETQRLRLRVETQAEMEALIAAQTDPALKTAYGEMLAGARSHPEHWEWYAVWRIGLKNGACAGDLSFKGPPENGAVEIGYGVLEAYRGRGIATEAVRAAVAWALAQPGVTAVEAETEPGNAASQRVLAKCGFLPTGKTGAEGPRFQTGPDRAARTSPVSSAKR